VSITVSITSNGATSATVTQPSIVSTTVSAQAQPTITATSGDTINVTVGQAGGSGSVTLSDATPAALGTASAGSSGTVSRSDHVHSSPGIAGVTGLQAALDGKQAAGSYAGSSHTHTASQITDLATSVVTSVNGQTGAVTVSGGSGGSYTLPVATSSVLGGVKQGSNVTIGTDGTLSVAAPTTSLAASAITGLATVATSGAYADLTGKPSAYSLPVATSSVLGGVKQGSNTTIAADGTISVAAPVTSLAASAITGLATVATSGKYSDISGAPSAYSLPVATSSVLGGVKQGSNVTIAADGTVSVAAPVTSLAASAITGLATVATSGKYSDLSGTPSSYSLPAATASVLGGVKTGSNVTIAADGTISVAAPVTTLAATSITGLATIATSGSASDLSAGTVPAARLPAATTSTAGAVIVGTGLAVSSGTISASVTSVAGRTGAVTLSASDVSGVVPSSTTGITGAAAITNLVSLTAAQYAALGTKNSSTVYIVSG
jgi:antitoxin (DNA-binding transcriptional repressor) of toxin-antitoxin stability system